jgi:hypothetical protein
MGMLAPTMALAPFDPAAAASASLISARLGSLDALPRLDINTALRSLTSHMCSYTIPYALSHGVSSLWLFVLAIRLSFIYGQTWVHAAHGWLLYILTPESSYLAILSPLGLCPL